MKHNPEQVNTRREREKHDAKSIRIPDEQTDRFADAIEGLNNVTTPLALHTRVYERAQQQI